VRHLGSYDGRYRWFGREGLSARRAQGWPDDGHKFIKGCFLVGTPISLLLWWGIIALVRSVL